MIIKRDMTSSDHAVPHSFSFLQTQQALITHVNTSIILYTIIFKVKQASLTAIPSSPFLLLLCLLTLDTLYLLSSAAAPCLFSAAVVSHYDSRQNSADTSQGCQMITELLQEPPSEACSKGSDCSEAC